MTVPDILFFIEINRYTRVFDDRKTLRLEWNYDGLKVCKNTEGATILCPDGKTISLMENVVIEWSKFEREKSYHICQNDIKGCEFRVFDENSNEWLKYTNGESTVEIMKQTILALEDIYGNTQSMEEITECLNSVAIKIPSGVNDDLRQIIINRWRLRLKRIAAEVFTNRYSTKNELNMAYYILKQPN